VGTAIVNDASLRLAARTVLRADRHGIPVGAERVAATPYDFRRARRIGTTRLDHCFTDLERGADGRARVELRHPHDAWEITLWADAAYPYLMLFTGDSQPSVDRRSLAVEPMSCPPNAFRTGEALIALSPGSSWVGEWGIALLRRQETNEFESERGRS
jgi:aldose 1-epimerase